MKIVFVPAATPAQRDAVAVALRARGVECDAADGGLATAGDLDADDALALAAMPGVATIEPSPAPASTVREAILTWAAGAATVLGVLSIAAANLPANIGAHADPLRTPSPLRPSWPLYAWYAAVDKSPTWLPVPLFFVLAALLLFFWPDLARPLATKRPAVHAVLGLAALLVVFGLVAVEMRR
jgi:hypothetical protein